MARTNKSLAQSSKSRPGVPATNKCLQALLRPFETSGKATPCKASSSSLSPRPHSWRAFTANAFAQSWHVKPGRRGAGVEAKEHRDHLLSPTQQSSFASSWVLGLKNAASSHGRRLRFFTPPNG